MSLKRGELYLVSPPPGDDPRRARAVVIVSRRTICDSKADKLVCAPVNTNTDGRSTEVPVGTHEGLKHASVINCDQLVLVRKSVLTHYVGSLSPKRLTALNAALRDALGL
ncbi:MAG TPA: type II toxin-antitoxin system PemK/MazF family toxin [Gemmatimonadaceae bacterium]